VGVVMETVLMWLLCIVLGGYIFKKIAYALGWLYGFYVDKD